MMKPVNGVWIDFRDRWGTFQDADGVLVVIRIRWMQSGTSWMAADGSRRAKPWAPAAV